MGQPAARKTDGHVHKNGGGPILEGDDSVLIGNLPAARLGDKVKHGKGVEAIAEGEPTVLINGRPAARMGDRVACGGIIINGCTSVQIGRDKDESCLLNAAREGALVVVPGSRGNGKS